MVPPKENTLRRPPRGDEDCERTALWRRPSRADGGRRGKARFFPRESLRQKDRAAFSCFAPTGVGVRHISVTVCRSLFFFQG